MKKTIFATFVLTAFLFMACNSGSSNKSNTASNNEQIESVAQQNEVHALINVKGKCEMCKDRIEKTAKEVQGVTLASWELEKEELHLHYNPATASIDDIAKALAAVGHDTDKFKADDAIYDALPACCKYRD